MSVGNTNIDEVILSEDEQTTYSPPDNGTWKVTTVYAKTTDGYEYNNEIEIAPASSSETFPSTDNTNGYGVPGSSNRPPIGNTDENLTPLLITNNFPLYIHNIGADEVRVIIQMYKVDD